MKKRSDGESHENGTLINRQQASSLYDESVEVVGADDVQSPPSSAGVPGQKSFLKENNLKSHANAEKEKINKALKNLQWQSENRASENNLSDNSEEEDDEDEDEEEDDDDDDNDIRAPIIHGMTLTPNHFYSAYDPLDYQQLAVSEEIKDIFNYITKYTPQTIELENKLCPFLPDFIPAVGDIDAFIKVPPPDGKRSGLGLTVLDEPCTQQSDPAVLQLQLRAIAKQSSAKAVVVKKIENAEKNAKSIEKWIKAISDLHSTKPSPTVQYTNPMPNLDNLMQEWPPETEEKLSTTAIPHPELDCGLSVYITIICNLFDIPVYESKMQSLHVFFSLYSTMKGTQNQLVQFETKK